jgi:hypothetical protein
MRIWDIHPGYLNRQSLLGEHRELHGMMNIILEGKKGYSRHPETLRWIDFAGALAFRHRILSREMSLRGYQDKSPVPHFSWPSTPSDWPVSYIDSPAMQFEILRRKYRDKSPGRIPLPKTPQQLWSQYKYSVMARSVLEYQNIGRMLAVDCSSKSLESLSETLVSLLRKQPAEGGIRNVLQHMWGYVSSDDHLVDQKNILESPIRLIAEIQRRSKENNRKYLLSSTALSEIAVWLLGEPD